MHESAAREWATIPLFFDYITMNRLALILLLSVAFAACDRQETAEPTKNNPASDSRSAGQDFIAVRIDGKNLTRREIIEDGKIVLRLNMNKARKTKIRRREMKAVEHYCRSAVSHEISKAAVRRYIADRNLTIPSNATDRATRRFERRYGALSKKLKRFHKIDDLKYMLGKDAFRADEMILEMARYEVMTNDVLKSSHAVVTDEMIDERLRKIQQANSIAVMTNAVIFAKATNVWERIVANELSFEEAALKFSEDEYIREGCDWGCFTRDQLEGEDAVLALLPTIKAGDITPPIESDGGVSILRKDEDDNEKTYSFSRVFFKLPYFYEEETREQARAALAEHEEKELIQEAIRANIGKLKVEYPDGTNMVWELTAQDFK